jgi:hypothetical protein
MTVESLQILAFREACKNYLQSPEPPEAFPQYKGLYSLVVSERDQKERIGQIRERCERVLKACLQQAFEADRPTLEALRVSLKPSGPFGQKMIADLYEQGVCPLNWYVYHHYSGAKKQELSSVVINWYKRVAKDFEDGVPQSLPMMSQFIGARKCSYISLPHLFSLANSVAQLKKMTYLGLKNAESTLARAYQFNKIGEDQKAISLEMSIAERIQGLHWCAELGGQSSQEALAGVYYHGGLGREIVGYSDEERKAGLKRMIDTEVGHNYYVTTTYQSDRFKFYTFRKRIECLTERAKAGDKHSLNALWELYGSNQLEDDAIEMTLTKEERWQRLNSLKTSANEKDFQEAYARWVAYPSKHLPFEGTISEHFAELERVTLQLNCWSGSQELLKVYYENCFKNTPLQIPLATRVAKIEQRARVGSSDAMEQLGFYYLPERNPYRKGKICPDGAKITDQPNPPPLAERMNLIWQIGIEGRHWNYLEEQLPISERDPRYQVARLALAHLKALKWMD